MKDVDSPDSADFAGLATRGYVVVPGFLGEEELDCFREDLRIGQSHSNSNYRLQDLTETLLEGFAPRLEWLASEVARQTDIRVSPHVVAAHFFATTGGQAFPWHQDHESYFTLQQHYHYLNCYVPVLKPSLWKSNLSVVPMDRLRDRSPHVYGKVLGGGASRFVPWLGRTLVIDDDQGGLHGVLPYDIAEIAETPSLAEGDLLLMRGDVVHKTQDTDTERAAASIRLADPDAEVALDRLVRGGLVKRWLMVNNRDDYSAAFRVLERSEGGRLPMGKFQELVRSPEPAAPAGRRTSAAAFLFDLLRLRLWGAAQRQTSGD